jgi:hypothetical protein
MPDDLTTSSPPAAGPDRLARLEQRLARIERQLGLTVAAESDEAPPALRPVVAAFSPAKAAQASEEFEFEVGQGLFARVGMVTLTIGGAFLLSLPLPALGPFGPSLAGFAVAAVLLWLARYWQQGFELVASYLRGSGMFLLWFAGLRLFFGTRPALAADSAVGCLLLASVVAANLAIGFRRKSPRLVALSLAMGYLSALAIGSAWPVIVTVVSQAAVATAADRRGKWPLVVVTGTVLGPLAYLVWSMGNLLRGGAYHFVSAPAAAPAFLLLAVLVVALGSLGRGTEGRETVFAGVRAALNCGVGYGVFLVHTAAAFPTGFVAAQGAASVLLIGLAVAFWRLQQCRASTFFYAMTGYGALSLAIIKASAMPEVFVWLSLQSIVVVGTAAWFRSRFIVVANFFIYVAIVLGYALLKEHETGISVGIGIVALISARILNWQKDQLELKTELMRNAYLVSGFIIFPYSLYFLVPATYVGLAWTGLALVYYLLNLIVRSQKYRWMGHGTLLLTTTYLVTVGTRDFEPLYRVVSFLALGTVLLIVSFVFTRLRRGRGLN